MPHNFIRNEVIKWDGSLKRVLSSQDGKVALFSMVEDANIKSSKAINIEIVELKAMRHALDNGTLLLVEDPYDALRYRGLSVKTASRAKANWALLEPLISRQDALFDITLRRKLLRDIYAIALNDESNVTYKNKQIVVRMKVQRLLWSYYQKGQSLNALAPDFGKNRGTPHTFTDKKPGVKAKDGSGIAITASIKAMMDKVCHQVLLNESQASIRHAHVAFIAEYKKTFPNCQEGQWPSYAQFYWFYRHNYSVAERNLKRLGKITYAKNNRPLHGSASDIAGNLGGLYLIDATEADAYICSEEDRKPIGRPWYYIVIDVATGMIASIFVSLESPQFDMSCKALYMAIADKKPFLQNLGLADKCHWDISGIPAAVMSDNAELQSDRLQDFLRNYHVSNSFHPAYRADCKGLVEMVFNIINKELAPEINATPDKIESHKAGHQEKRHLASLTLNEFQKLVVCAAMVANCRTRDNTPKNYPKGRSNTPELIMEWAKDTGRNELIHPGNLELTRIMLMPRGTPSFSEHGVTFDKITWTCAEARRLGLFERKAARTSTSGYTLAYDRDNVSYAWLFPDIQHKPEIYWECSLAPRSDHLAGMTKSQAQAFISQNNAANKVARNQRDNFAADVYIEIKKTVKEAEAKKQAQPSTGQTRAEIIKDIKENRSQETIVQAQKRHEVFSCKNSIAQEQNSTDKKKKKLYPERTIYPDSIDDLPD